MTTNEVIAKLLIKRFDKGFKAGFKEGRKAERERIFKIIDGWWNECKVVIGSKEDKYICLELKEIERLKQKIEGEDEN